MRLYIKNMVCDRCIMVVTDELKKLKLKTKSVVLGEVELEDEADRKLLTAFGDALTKHGFELIEGKTAKIISQIKKTIVEYVHGSDQQRWRAIKFSVFLSERIGKDYHFLSGLFSGVEGITIEQYLISHKIEKVKELLVYDELTLSEIAEQLNYSSVQHLSTQFKKNTGLTPSHFKKIGAAKRVALDKV